jgi:hypothetical protein
MSFYLGLMPSTSLCRRLGGLCRQREEVMIKLASVFHTEVSEREPSDLCQFRSSHEIQPHGVPPSQDERRTHERSATYRFPTKLEEERVHLSAMPRSVDKITEDTAIAAFLIGAIIPVRAVRWTEDISFGSGPQFIGFICIIEERSTIGTLLMREFSHLRAIKWYILRRKKFRHRLPSLEYQEDGISRINKVPITHQLFISNRAEVAQPERDTETEDESVGHQ